MGKQIRHLRTSKTGKRFVAGKDQVVSGAIRRVRFVDSPYALGFGENAYIREKWILTKINRDKEGDIHRGWNDDFWRLSEIAPLKYEEERRLRMHIEE